MGTTGILASIIVSLIIIIAFIIFRTKKVLRKVIKSVEETKNELRSSFELYFSRWEARMVKPFTEFENPKGVNDWLIIFTFNRLKLLNTTIDSIRKHERDIKILVIDNGSSDGTKDDLLRMLDSNLIQRVILNKSESIPQWQKCYNIHQAYKLLSVEKVGWLGWLDDDILVKKPFVGFSKRLIDSNITKNVGMINFVVDEIQNRNHPMVDKIEFEGTEVLLKKTLVGMFVFFKSELLKEIGLPPIGEGIDDLSVEDWYYSRVMSQKGIFVVAVDFADHLGYKTSIRDSIT